MPYIYDAEGEQGEVGLGLESCLVNVMNTSNPPFHSRVF